MTIQPNPTAPLWPAEFQGCRITGQFIDLLGRAVTGSVVLTPTAVTIIAGTSKKIIVGRSITIPLDENGAFDVTVPASDDPDTNPTGWTYSVVETFPGGRSYSIDAPMNSTRDLTAIVPVPSANGVAITRGEAGPEGPAGPAGTIPQEMYGAGAVMGAWVQQNYLSGSVVTHGGKTWVANYDVDASWGVEPGVNSSDEWADVSIYPLADKIAALDESLNTSSLLPWSGGAVSPNYHHFVSGNIARNVTYQMPNVSDRSYWTFDAYVLAPGGYTVQWAQNAVHQVPITWPGGTTTMPAHTRATLYRFTFQSGSPSAWIAEIVADGNACSDIGGMGGLPGRLRRGRSDTAVTIGEWAIIGIFLEKAATITRVTTDFYNLTGTGGRYHGAIYARPGLLTMGNLVAALPDIPCSNADVSVPANVTLPAGHYWLVSHLDGQGTLTAASNRRPSYFGIIGNRSNQGCSNLYMNASAWPGAWPTTLTGVITNTAGNIGTDAYEYHPIMLEWSIN